MTILPLSRSAAITAIKEHLDQNPTEEELLAMLDYVQIRIVHKYSSHKGVIPDYTIKYQITENEETIKEEGRTP
jgi:hypothetical protein